MAGENENNELQTLQILVQFLNRVELKGQEVPAFNAALEYLQQKAQPLLAQAQAQGNSEIVTGAALPSTGDEAVNWLGDECHI